MDTIKIFVNKVIHIFEVNNSNSVKLSIFSILALIFISSFLHQSSFSSPSDGTTRPQYLYDNANLINNKYRPLIDGYLRNLDRQTSAEIVIYTIPSFIGHGIKKDGVEINDRDTLANYLFNEVTLDGTKGIGKKGKDNGVLILFSSERDAAGGSMRIEVGRGLEGNITDGTAGAILDSYLVPARQENVPQEDILSILRNQLGGDNLQSQRLFEEGTRLLQERTGKQGLFDSIMQNSKRAAFN